MKKYICVAIIVFLMLTPVFSASSNIFMIAPGVSEETEEQVKLSLRIEEPIQTVVLDSKHIEALYMQKREHGRLHVQVIGFNTFETNKIKKMLERVGVKNYLVRLIVSEGFSELDMLDALIEATEHLTDPLNPEKVELAREEYLMCSHSEDLKDIVEHLEKQVLEKIQELKRELLSEEIEELYDELVKKEKFTIPKDFRQKLTDWLERSQKFIEKEDKGQENIIENWLNKLEEGKWMQDIKKIFADFFDQLVHRIRSHNGLERS